VTVAAPPVTVAAPPVTVAAPPVTDDDGLVPCKVADHLEQDAVIRGQRFACVSFVSPKDAIAAKDAFCVREFLSKLTRDVHEMLETVETVFGAQNEQVKDTVRLVLERHQHLWDDDTMQTEFRLFQDQEAEMLDENFKRKHGAFSTSVHGFKIRGSYDSVEEAQSRAKVLKRQDDRFNVFIAEVGCWCPWDPSVAKITHVEYSETELNTLMKKYNEQQEARDELYNTRRVNMIERIDTDRETWLERIKEGMVAKQQADPSADPSADTSMPPVTMELIHESDIPEGATIVGM
jgi:hypothetical protein